jgi:hypothetical protein
VRTAPQRQRSTLDRIDNTPRHPPVTTHRGSLSLSLPRVALDLALDLGLGVELGLQYRGHRCRSSWHARMRVHQTVVVDVVDVVDVVVVVVVEGRSAVESVS